VRSLDGSSALFLFGDALGEQGIVLLLLLLLADDSSAVERSEVAAALETDGGDKALDLRSFGVGLSVLLLGRLDFPSDDVFPDIVLLGEIEESPDFSRSLGTESLGKDIVGQTFNLAFSLLYDDQTENSNIGANDAAADGLASAFTIPAGAVARVTVREEESDTGGEENTLLHGETLLVISTSNTEDVTSPFGTKSVTLDLLRDPFVVEDTSASLVIDLNGLLLPCCRVGDVELHRRGVLEERV